MNVPFLDLKACYQPLKEEIMDAIGGVVEQCNFVLGQPVKDFEESVRKYTGTEYALGVASGTDALIIALRAAGIGAGDEVITTPYTFIATPESVWAAGGRPVFCDISPVTYNLDPDAVRKFIENECETGENGLINKKTGGRVKGIMPVHLYGLMADMNGFLELKEEYGLKIIEDAAQAQGSRIRINGSEDGSEMIQAGAAGDVGCFSFYPSKNLGGAGDGGMIVTSDEDIYQVAKSLHVHGASKKKYFHDMFGYNSRLDSMQAAILAVKFKHLDEWLEKRRKNGLEYIKTFREMMPEAGIDVIGTDEVPADGALPENTIALPAEPEGIYHTYNTFDIRLPNRDRTMQHLRDNGIGCMIYYPLSLHRQIIFDYLGYGPGSLPVSETICDSILALPQYPDLTVDMIAHVVGTLKDFYMKR